MMVLLIVLNIVAIILLINFRNNDEPEMIVSNINNHSSDVSIMIQSSSGSTTYNRSSSETWPDSTKYHLNPSKSYCKNGSVYSLNGSKIIVNLNRADDCWFYFDLGANITFTYEYAHYVSNPAGPPFKSNNMTNNPGSDYYNIKMNNNSIAISQICINDTNDLSSCNWQNIRKDQSDGYCTGSSDYCNKFSLKLSGEDGLKNVYAYIKDSSGNIYGPASDTVIVDTVAPLCSFAVSSSGVTINGSDNKSSVYKFYTITGYSPIAYNKPLSLTSGRYIAYIYDEAGNTKSCGLKVETKSAGYNITVSCCGLIGQIWNGCDGCGYTEYCPGVVPPTISTISAPSCNIDVGKWCSITECVPSSSGCGADFTMVSGTNYCYKDD